ncbi:MAG: GHMP kinase [Gemmatimonadetes bacterium]|nr:MAG: GHMP kinase [Gemmatimonadota bacterium]
MRVRTLDEVRSSGGAERLEEAIARGRETFATEGPLFVARAPGRLDVMGGIADYSGSLVLQLPLAVATTAVLQPTEDRTIEIVSRRGSESSRFSMALDELVLGELRDAATLAAWFASHEHERWAAYVIGVVHACFARRDAGDVARRGGFRLLVESEVPEGKGVSSSAALEVACLSAIATRYGMELTGEEIATSSQWAENHIAGAPCGIMDQMTSACGRRDRLLRLRCQPGTVEGHVDIPPGFKFYGIDSGIRHAVTGSDYGTVRTAAFMGYRIIADVAGLPSSIDATNVRELDTRWRGYLANISPAEFESRFAAQLPERMTGAEFLRRYDGITDAVTRVHPERAYAVRQSTAHPVYENARVTRFAELLAELWPGTDDVAREMGVLMAESHASYGACGLGSEGTDQLVEMVHRAGPGVGMFGAKITGGGSGGTIAVLGTTEAEASVREIARRYAEETGREAEVFVGSGPGAEESGVVVA